jgi:hypothetical protein
MLPCAECRKHTDLYISTDSVIHMALNAASYGHIDCFCRARELGAPCDDITIFHAALHGRLDCVRYVHAKGAPLDGSLTPHASMVSWENWNCFRYVSLHLPSWQDIPPPMAAWRTRVRATAAAVLRIVRRNRAHAAATVIQRFWLERHYAPGGKGMALALDRCADAWHI